MTKKNNNSHRINTHHSRDRRWTIHQGDVLQVLPNLAPNSCDGSLVDGPYGLKFMGHNWDGEVPPVIVWQHLLRVCKPGAYLLAFGGTKTFHRLTCNIEDAGWEIRDCLCWLYGEGFPKNRNISKDIDKTLGAKRKVVGKKQRKRNAGRWYGFPSPDEHNVNGLRRCSIGVSPFGKSSRCLKSPGKQ